MIDANKVISSRGCARTMSCGCKKMPLALMIDEDDEDEEELDAAAATARRLDAMHLRTRETHKRAFSVHWSSVSAVGTEEDDDAEEEEKEAQAVEEDAQSSSAGRVHVVAPVTMLQ